MLTKHMPPGAVRDAYAARDACIVRPCGARALPAPRIAHYSPPRRCFRSHLLLLLTAQAHDWSEASTTRILLAPTDLPGGLSVGDRIVTCGYNSWFVGTIKAIAPRRALPIVAVCDDHNSVV
jgi:hypothetical protein